MADVVCIISDKQKHATEINVAMEERLPMVDVYVKVVGQEHVAKMVGVMIIFSSPFSLAVLLSIIGAGWMGGSYLCINVIIHREQ